jgi:hypothetical protein
VQAMETEAKTAKTPSVGKGNGELRQFLGDYWTEMKKFDPIISLLTAWKIFEAPEGFETRPVLRTLLFIIQFFLSIGLTVQVGCNGQNMPEGPVVILSLLLVTIPIEILNAVWFRIVKSDAALQKEGDKGCCTCVIQTLGKTFGYILGFLVLTEGIIFFVLTFAGIHPGCSRSQKYGLATNVVLFQFLLMPVLMSLPYWRQQSILLSFIGQFGPVIGLIMHIRKYGFHPRPQEAFVTANAKSCDVENPVAKQ